MTDKQSARKQRQIARFTAPNARRRYDPSVRVPVDRSRLNLGITDSFLFSQLVYENGSFYYTDKMFDCRDCGERCLWTADNQKWWYEEKRFVHITARCCRACRIKKRERKAEARRVSEEGKRQKLARLAGATR